MPKSDMPTKLLWVDLEMTGLNPEKQRIIEVAAVVTDFELNIVDSYEAIIHQPEEVLEEAEDWPKQNMSNLFDQVRASDLIESEVEHQMVELVKRNFGEEKAVLAGNSIHQDRRFISRWWVKLDATLHYRMFDVSTLKIWIQGTQQKSFEKSETHRAKQDIFESIDELKWSLNNISDK